MRFDVIPSRFLQLRLRQQNLQRSSYSHGHKSINDTQTASSSRTNAKHKLASSTTTYSVVMVVNRSRGQMAGCSRSYFLKNLKNCFAESVSLNEVSERLALLMTHEFFQTFLNKYVSTLRKRKSTFLYKKLSSSNSDYKKVCKTINYLLNRSNEMPHPSGSNLSELFSSFLC